MAEEIFDLPDGWHLVPGDGKNDDPDRRNMGVIRVKCWVFCSDRRLIDCWLRPGGGLPRNTDLMPAEPEYIKKQETLLGISFHEILFPQDELEDLAEIWAEDFQVGE